MDNPPIRLIATTEPYLRFLDRVQMLTFINDLRRARIDNPRIAGKCTACSVLNYLENGQPGYATEELCM